MTATAAEEVIDLSAIEDFGIPCQYPWRFQPERQPCPDTAVWIVQFTTVKPCGCPNPNDLVFYCDHCWTRFQNVRTRTCQQCRTTYSIEGTVMKVERL